MRTAKRLPAAPALDWLRRSDTGFVLLALLIGAGAGVGAIAFRWLIKSFTLLLTGRSNTSMDPLTTHASLPWLGMWAIVLAPVVAGLVYGPLVHVFAREARGHGVPEVMFAVERRGGRIAPQVAVVKALASALCIGGGGSVGREGPIVQIGSALGSSVGGLVRVSEERRRLMVACGAAAGIAATFNAPLAGVFFAMELILVDFAARSFGMVVLSAVTASVIARAALGDHAFLDLPVLRVEHLATYGLIGALGILAGIAGVGFTRVLYAIEDACDWLWRGPEWARPAVGGLALGLLLLAVPQMYGVGYPVLAGGVAGKYAVGFLLLLVVAKMVATSLTIGIGGSGGVFAPSLFIGAMLGAAFGQTVAVLLPGTTGSPGVYALMGMGAVFAGAARAPITAVVILFELTGEYSLILPLMVAVVLATGTANLLTGDTIYSLKLRRRGVHIGGTSAAPLRFTLAGTVMRTVGTTLVSDDDVRQAATALENAPNGRLPVLSPTGEYEGVVTAEAVAEAFGSDDMPSSILELVETTATLRADDTLATVLPLMGHDEAHGLPVLDEAGQLIGWLLPQDVLRALDPGPDRTRAQVPA